MHGGCCCPNGPPQFHCRALRLDLLTCQSLEVCFSLSYAALCAALFKKQFASIHQSHCNTPSIAPQGLGFEMDLDVPKGRTWDGVMQVGDSLSRAAHCCSAVKAQPACDCPDACMLACGAALPPALSAMRCLLPCSARDRRAYRPPPRPRRAAQLDSLRTAVFRGVIGGVPVLLLRPADWDGCNLFRGGRIYGGSYNEMESYLYFCRCVFVCCICVLLLVSCFPLYLCMQQATCSAAAALALFRGAYIVSTPCLWSCGVLLIVAAAAAACGGVV